MRRRPTHPLSVCVCVRQVFQSAITEAKRFKASGGDALADMLDLLTDQPGSGDRKEQERKVRSYAN
jgi:hypothetical protein